MKTIILSLLLLGSLLQANEIYTKTITKPFSVYFPELKKSIEKNHMGIIYEFDLVERFKKKGFDKKFGDAFNKNGLDKIVTLLICNGYVGNQVSNIDPNMMALCPIKITVIKKGAQTTITFLKYQNVTQNKEIKELLSTLHKIVINTIDLTLDKYMESSVTGGYEEQHEGN